MLAPIFAQNKIDSQQVWIFVVAGIALLIFLFMLILFFSFVRLYIQSLLTGAKIGIFDLIGMKLRNVDGTVRKMEIWRVTSRFGNSPNPEVLMS